MLRSLGEALRSSQDAVGRLDVTQIYQHTLEQENLCGRIQNLDREIKKVQQALAARLRLQAANSDSGRLAQRVDAALAERLRLAAKELHEAQVEVRLRNRVQAGLLRRSRRSVNIMMNFMANYLETYRAVVVGGASRSS
jgi:hypothetical protein